MTILDKIIAQKRKEVSERKIAAPTSMLVLSPAFECAGLSLKKNILDKAGGGFITEFKRRSPSKGNINESVSITDTVAGYEAAGAAGVSVLTDSSFFGGSEKDLKNAKATVSIPVLRKDFIVDEYQVIEAKSIGADAILLIAAALTPVEVKRLASLAHAINLEVLLELHDESELGHICNEVSLVGVNNRNLKDFTLDINQSYKLLNAIPASFARISESGITKPEDAVALRQAGFNGFLIGSGFMQFAHPAARFATFIADYKTLMYAAEGLRAE